MTTPKECQESGRTNGSSPILNRPRDGLFFPANILTGPGSGQPGQLPPDESLIDKALKKAELQGRIYKRRSSHTSSVASTAADWLHCFFKHAATSPASGYLCH